MANDQYTVLRTEENGIEYFTVQETGECGMSQRGLARACGKDHRTIKNLTNNLGNKSLGKRLNSFSGKDLSLGNVFGKKNGKVTLIYRSDFCATAIKYYALKGSEKAQEILDEFLEIGLTHFIHSKTGYADKAAAPQAQERISRILDAPNPWEKMFEASFCRKVYSWMGGRFYWVYLYDFLTPEERCKVDRLNPIDPVTGKRDDRIHQYFDDQIRDRLYRHAQRVTDLVDTSTGFQDFATRFARFSGTNQLHLF
jgi:hypothetical protein